MDGLDRLGPRLPRLPLSNLNLPPLISSMLPRMNKWRLLTSTIHHGRGRARPSRDSRHFGSDSAAPRARTARQLVGLESQVRLRRRQPPRWQRQHLLAVGFGAATTTDTRSEGPQPHSIDLSFPKRVFIHSIAILTSHPRDDSYTPSRISIRAGTGVHDLQEVRLGCAADPRCNMASLLSLMGGL